MSVLMTLRVSGDSKGIEATPQETFDAVIARAKEHGLIAHRFWGNGSEILVVDEWPDAQSFQDFFAGQPEIADVMRAGGAQGPPEITVYRLLDTPDRF